MTYKHSFLILRPIWNYVYPKRHITASSNEYLISDAVYLAQLNTELELHYKRALKQASCDMWKGQLTYFDAAMLH